MFDEKQRQRHSARVRFKAAFQSQRKSEYLLFYSAGNNRQV